MFITKFDYNQFLSSKIKEFLNRIFLFIKKPVIT